MTSPEEVRAVMARCSNAGRWGADDELGTLNLITPEKRRAASRLVREGVSISLARDLDMVQRPANPRPMTHVLHREPALPDAVLESMHLDIHGFGTHLDALGHLFLDGVGYNGRRQDDVVTGEGLAANSIQAMRHGILTRGVLLDVAAARDVDWLAPGEWVTAADLDAAEATGQLPVEPGDAVFVHTGLERRAAPRHQDDLEVRAGLDLEAVCWLHDRDVALFSGDCVERLPPADPVLPFPLHQVGMVAMGLALLDWPRLGALVDACARYGRREFLLTVAPLRIPGGSGSPVNPIATF